MSLATFAENLIATTYTIEPMHGNIFGFPEPPQILTDIHDYVEEFFDWIASIFDDAWNVLGLDAWADGLIATATKAVNDVIHPVLRAIIDVAHYEQTGINKISDYFEGRIATGMDTFCNDFTTDANMLKMFAHPIVCGDKFAKIMAGADLMMVQVPVQTMNLALDMIGAMDACPDVINCEIDLDAIINKYTIFEKLDETMARLDASLPSLY